MPMANSNQIIRNDKQITYTLYKKGTTIYYTENKINQATVTIDKKSTKKILGNNCYKAMYKSSANEVYELWLTNDLKVICNPLEAGLINGTVLEINSKKVNYKAIKIDFKLQDKEIFEIPSTYIKITNEQAEDLQEELNEKK